MKCPRCRADNPDNSRFCGSCAAPLNPEGEDLVSFTKTLVPPVHGLKKGALFANKYRISDEIGRKLDVRAVIEGSVRKAGNRLCA